MFKKTNCSGKTLKIPNSFMNGVPRIHLPRGFNFNSVDGYVSVQLHTATKAGFLQVKGKCPKVISQVAI